MVLHKIKSYRRETTPSAGWDCIETNDSSRLSTVTPPTVEPMYIGASMAAFDTLAPLLTNTGSKSGAINQGPQVRRSYDTSASFPNTFASSTAGGDPGRGVLSHWSFTPGGSGPGAFPTNYLSDTVEQNRFNGFLNSWPSNHYGFITFAHEPENNGYNLADFRAACSMMYDQFQASSINKSHVKFGPIIIADTFRTGAAVNYVPANNAKFDFIGIDFYEYWRPSSAPIDSGFNPPKYPPRRTMDYLIGPAVDFANARGKPIVIGEYSNHPDPAAVNDRPDRFQAAVDYCDNLGCLSFSFFHSSAGAHGPWWIDSFPNWSNITDHSNLDQTTLTKLRNLLGGHAVNPGV